MRTVRCGRGHWASRWRLALRAAAAAGAVWWLLASRTLSHELLLTLPVAPRDLAHFLADFGNEPRLDPRVSSWSVENESGNYSWWSYSVNYKCGPRCEAHAHITAHDEPLHLSHFAHHPTPREHRLHARHTLCSSSALPWPLFCMDDEWWVSVTAGRSAKEALYAERSSRRCSLWQWAAGAGCGAQGLAREREGRARRLRDLLQLG